MSVATRARWADLYRSGHFGQVALLAFGVWLHAADELMVSTVTPAMTAEIGGERFIAWLTALYEIGSIVAGAGSALAVLRFGLNRSMSTAACLYLAGCLISGASPSMAPMLAGRLVQGLGGGAMVAIAFVAVHRLLPGHLTARVYALISMVWGVSAFTGPMIGAGFAEAGWWRGAFFLFALQAGIFGATVLARLRETARTPAAEQTAVGGKAALLGFRIGLLAGGVIVIAAAGIEVGALRSLLLVGTGIAVIGVFLRLDGKAGADRLLPRQPYHPGVAQGSVMILILFLSASTAGLITYGPLLLTRLHGLDAVAVGAILLLESVGWSVVAISLSGVPQRRQPLAIAGGFMAVAASVAGLVHAMVAGPVWLVAAFAFLQGGGFGAAWSFLVRRTLAIVAEAESERIASAIPTVQRLGYALGAAYVGIIANGVGFADDASAQMAARTSWSIFALSLVPAAIGLAAVFRFLRFREAE